MFCLSLWLVDRLGCFVFTWNTSCVFARLLLKGVLICVIFLYGKIIVIYDFFLMFSCRLVFCWDLLPALKFKITSISLEYFYALLSVVMESYASSASSIIFLGKREVKFFLFGFGPWCCFFFVNYTTHTFTDFFYFSLCMSFTTLLLWF